MQQALRLIPPAKTGWAASGVVHAGLLAALAVASSQAPITRPSMAGRREVIVLEVAMTPAPPAFETEDLVVDVEVKPRETRVFEQRFTRAEPTLTRNEEINVSQPQGDAPPPIEIARRDPADELHEPPPAPAAPAASMPRRSTAAPAIPALPPEPIGTDDEVPARRLDNRPPQYPDEAIRNRWEGTVCLRLAVSDAGDVSSVEVARSSGWPLLDAAAVRAVSDWRFEPAQRAGRPVATVEVQCVHFRLR